MSNVETLPATQTTQGFEPLTADEIRKMNAYWRACNYLSAGMLYLCHNPLLREPLKPEHIKNRLLGHWGSDPGQSFIWVHMNRLIKKYDLNTIYLSGPGHGAPATLSNCYLEGVYSEVYPDKSQDLQGLAAIARPKHQDRFMRAANWGTAFPMDLARPSTIPT
jgi:xylulose-5-phosphate/fructose-6-phosphate phosphoketolase